jgi:hypothetical protein
VHDVLQEPVRNLLLERGDLVLDEIVQKRFTSIGVITVLRIYWKNVYEGLCSEEGVVDPRPEGTYGFTYQGRSDVAGSFPGILLGTLGRDQPLHDGGSASFEPVTTIMNVRRDILLHLMHDVVLYRL